MADRMKGKRVLVTGAGSSGKGWGNGKAAAVLYTREGARVMGPLHQPRAAGRGWRSYRPLRLSEHATAMWTSADDNDSRPEGAQSIDRALAVLQLVGRAGREGIRPADLITESGLHKPTARRVLFALMRLMRTAPAAAAVRERRERRVAR